MPCCALSPWLRPTVRYIPRSWRQTSGLCSPSGLALVTLLAIVTGKSRPAARRPVFVLLALTFASFVPWMATTGNGRYFMPYLILVGPLCIGLVSILPSTRGIKASVALIVLGLQGFALYQNNPWKPFDSWQSIPWAEGPSELTSTHWPLPRIRRTSPYQTCRCPWSHHSFPLHRGG